MANTNNKPTIISMAVLAIAISSVLHEGLGHGVVALLRGDIPTELTSNHLSDLRPDRLVDVGGTLVNLVAGGLCLFASRRLGERANLRYFLWLVGCFNLLDGAGYFLFSGILGLGDWAAAIEGLPHPYVLRVVMSVLGAALYRFVVWAMARSIEPFCPDRGSNRDLYNTVGRLPYYAACGFYCVAGAFDPLGPKLLFLSTIPAAFGGLSGMMWADVFLPKVAANAREPLAVARQPAWWIAAIVVGLAYIVILGRGVTFAH
ncbi:hypothetical protein SAMN05421819_1764 [Bryocella elongata]|uniref:Uncharacterized protein n=1 Tax=Bryocella elongata TaxID=863522 RepID=A0A1H5WVG6_9BACT|nr:hypothetical protein [Bryocella elongata]SEG03481.1 hypothetical protein SAMN05421819_1764 [Bryocella elongata]